MEKRNNQQIIGFQVNSSIFFPRGDGVNSTTPKIFPASTIAPWPSRLNISYGTFAQLSLSLQLSDG